MQFVRPLKLRGKLIGEDLGKGKPITDFFRILVINGFYALGHGLVVRYVTVREIKIHKTFKNACIDTLYDNSSYVST